MSNIIVFQIYVIQSILWKGTLAKKFDAIQDCDHIKTNSIIIAIANKHKIIDEL